MAPRLRIGHFEKIEPCNAGNEEEHIPEPRSGHRLVVDEGNLYSIGGYNPLFWHVDNTDDTYYPLFRELWRFNFATRRWIKEEGIGHMPCELASHSAILKGRSILVFGGTGVPFGESSSNDLYEYSLDKKEWQLILCSGEFPQKKYGHAMVVHEDSLYVVGGTTGYVYNASVHVLDICESVWRNPDVGLPKLPAGRYRHEVACDGKAIYMLGGGTAVTVVGLKEIPVFDLVTEDWRTVHTQPDPQHGYPPPRRCHGCVQYKDTAYIIGGLCESSILGDVWGFCLKQHKWFKHPAVMPVPAYFHSVGISKEGCISVFGGVVCIDNERTNEIFQLWIATPSLKELCWQTICRSTKLIEQFSRKELYQLGVPAEFLGRVS